MTRLRIQDFTDDCFVQAQAEVTPGQQAPIPRPCLPVRFGDNSVSLVGLGMPVDQRVASWPDGPVAPLQHVDYLPLNEHDAYLFLDQYVGVNLRHCLGRAARLIREMRIDLRRGALPVLHATFHFGAQDPVAPTMAHLTGLSGGPLRLASHTLNMANDCSAILEAEFVIDNRTDRFTYRSDDLYAAKPAPEQLPKARKSETRFREWSASLERSQRGR